MKIVDQNGFNEALNNKYVLVDFYADWCGPCKMVGPVLEELDAENDQLTIVKVNVDNELDLASKYGVQSIPNKERKARLKSTLMLRFQLPCIKVRWMC